MPFATIQISYTAWINQVEGMPGAPDQSLPESGRPGHQPARPGRPTDPGYGVEAPDGTPNPPIYWPGQPDQGLPPAIAWPIAPPRPAPGEPAHPIVPPEQRPGRPGQPIARPPELSRPVRPDQPIAPPGEVTPEQPIYIPAHPEQGLPPMVGFPLPPCPPAGEVQPLKR